MARTYGELILEYENFAHSKENFELMKECYEITLMEQFADSQQFMADNIAGLREEYQGFDESYFIEATDAETASSVKEAASSKAAGFFKKIWDKFMTALNNIKGFFVKIFSKIQTSKRNMEKVGSKLEGVDYSNVELDMEFYKSIVNNAWPQSYLDDGFDISPLPKAEIAKGFTMYIGSIPGKDKESAAIRNKMTAAFSSNGVRVRLINKTGTNKPPRVTTADKVAGFHVNFANEDAKPDMIAAWVKGIVAERNHADIDLSDQSIEKMISALKEVEKQVKAPVETKDGVNIKSEQMMKMYQDLLAIFADTMKMYTYVDAYRKAVVSKVIGSMNELTKPKKAEKPKEEPTPATEEPKPEE